MRNLINLIKRPFNWIDNNWEEAMIIIWGVPYIIVGIYLLYLTVFR